jgi:hypothetical protein
VWQRAALTALVVFVAACVAASGSPRAPQAAYACDVETRRKVTCDHLYPELTGKARDLCFRTWSCASQFLRPESIAMMVECEAHAACSVDCANADASLAPLAEEIAFTTACEAHEALCHLDCKALVAGLRSNVAAFWSDMTTCFAAPECGEPSMCLLHASQRPLQVVGCMF